MRDVVPFPNSASVRIHYIRLLLCQVTTWTFTYIRTATFRHCVQKVTSIRRENLLPAMKLSAVRHERSLVKFIQGNYSYALYFLLRSRTIVSAPLDVLV